MLFSRPIAVGDGGCRGPLKIRTYFSGRPKYYVKFGQFWGKNHVKFRNFVNFSGKYRTNSDILIICLARIM